MPRRFLTLVTLLAASLLAACVAIAPATPAAPSPTPPLSATATPSPTPLPDTPTPAPTVALPTATPTDLPTPLAEATQTPWQVRTLLVAPGQPGRLYAFQQSQVPSATGPWQLRARLLVSDDLATTWRPFPGGLPPVADESCIVNFNLDYAQTDALYASTCAGLYRWSDAGWAFLSPLETGMVAVVYGQPQTVWATSRIFGAAAVQRSDDGGRTWADASFGLVHFNGVANVAIDPRDANTLYAIIWPKYAGSYLRRGTAAGQWQEMPTPPDVGTIGIGMTMDGSSGALYVTVDTPTAQLWRSPQPNLTAVSDVPWEMVHDFGRAASVELLASGWSPQGLALYANIRRLDWQDEGYARVSEPQLHGSPDGGQTWQPLPIPTDATE